MSELVQRIADVGVLEKTEAVDLGDFDEAFRGAVFEVWLTPTRAHIEAFGEVRDWLKRESERARRDRDGIRDEEKRRAFDTESAGRLQAGYDARLDAWLAETWRNVKLEEVRQIHAHLSRVAPPAWDWLANETHTTIGRFRRRAAGN